MSPEEKNKVLEALGGLPEEVYDELVLELKDQLKQNILQLEELIQKKDLEGLKSLGHGIKGAAGNLRVYQVQELGKAIEDCCSENGNIDGIKEVISLLNQYISEP